MAEESLKNKTIKGTFWSAADAFLGHGVTFLVGIILARLLTPAEYGLIGIVLIFTIILSGIVDSGFSSALIRKKNVTREDYNTMFITNLASSILMFVLLFWCAPLIADFFGNDELISLTRVTGLILIFQALSITQVTILTKELDFKTKTKASFLAAIGSGVVGIVMAYSGCGVWSLVGQQLSNKLFFSLSLWVLVRWIPKLSFSKTSFSYMWGFGWKIMLSGLLNNIWNQMYQVVVGKCYSPETLGQYSRAKEYAGLFSSNFTAILQRVTYPALADVQDNQARMVAAYRKVIKVSMYITAVSMVFMAAVSEPLIYCMIGPQWKEAASYLPLICLSMSFYPLHAINLNMLQIQGRSDIYLYIEILKKIISIIPLFFGIFVGIFWMLWGTIVTGILSFFINSYYTGKKLNYTSWMQLRDIMPSYGLGLIVALTVYFLKYLPLSYFIVLLLQIIVGIVTILTVSRVSKMEEYDEFVIIAKGVVEKFYHFKK